MYAHLNKKWDLHIAKDSYLVVWQQNIYQNIWVQNIAESFEIKQVVALYIILLPIQSLSHLTMQHALCTPILQTWRTFTHPVHWLSKRAHHKSLHEIQATPQRRFSEKANKHCSSFTAKPSRKFHQYFVAWSYYISFNVHLPMSKCSLKQSQTIWNTFFWTHLLFAFLPLKL